MGTAHGVGDLTYQMDALRQGKLRSDHIQGLSIHKAHGDEWSPRLGHPHFVNLTNRRVMQAALGPCFPAVASGNGLGTQWEHLEGDMALGFRVPSLEDLAHGSAANGDGGLVPHRSDASPGVI